MTYLLNQRTFLFDGNILNRGESPLKRIQTPLK